MTAPDVEVVLAQTEAEFAAAKTLILAYADSLDFSIEYQGFSQEMAQFPEGYQRILLAKQKEAVIGTVGLKPHKGSQTVCEMKRMYVAPTARGTGAGRLLADTLMADAKRLGYQAMLLDTLRRFEAAHALYLSLGFEETEAFEHYPEPDAVFLKRNL